jgi:serine/threonine-protein kinase
LDHLDQARRDQAFAARLDSIHLDRAAVVDGRFDFRANHTRADREYEAAFREAGFGEVHDDPDVVAARVAASNIREALLGALDDWAVCAAADQRRQSWILEVARRADGDPTGSRDRLRASWNDPAALGKTAATALAAKASVQLLVALGERLQAVGADAIPFSKQVQEEHPGDFWANVMLGHALQAKNPGEAIRYFQAALAVRPGAALAHYNLGIALGKAGRLEDAIDHFRQALHINPKYAYAHYGLGNALTGTGRLDDAIDHFRQALDINPNIAYAHYGLGIALGKGGRQDEAIKEYRAAIALDPKFAKAHTNLGNTLAEARRLDEAIQEYRAAIALDPRYAEAHYSLGNTLFLNKDVDGAIKEYRAAIALDRKLAEAHYNLGFALLDKNELGEAIKEYRAAIEIDPKHPAAHYNLGNALRATKDLEGAVREYRTAIDLRPDCAEPHCNLGHVLRDLGRFAEGLEELRKGHELGSKQPGWRYPSAQWVKDMERMVELDRKLPAILAGRDKPTDDAERLALALLCQQPCKQLYAAAARQYADAFAHDSKLTEDMRQPHRYNAACAAALAGCGLGKNAAKLTEAELTQWRKQAREWLQADLAVWSKKLDGGAAADRVLAHKILMHWRADPDLAGLREPSALDRLSADERNECLALWNEVGIALNRAHEAK